MELDIDIETEDAPRVQGSPSSVLSVSLAPPRLAASPSTPSHLEPPLHLRIDNDEPVSRHRIDADHAAQPSCGARSTTPSPEAPQPDPRWGPFIGARTRRACGRACKGERRRRGRAGSRGARFSAVCGAGVCWTHKKSSGGMHGRRVLERRVFEHEHRCICGHRRGRVCRRREREPYAVVERTG
ncbi:hypothetical protein B0H14DRAFT_3017323 [Mycena olivaceomarginata]|nr:hypothetical protein B0H14DRAFT_3017323 [Mycena olivaceomarginata]